MDKLKIRDNVDLKELEKFWFDLVNYTNVQIYKYDDGYCNVIIGPDRIIHLNHFTVNNTAGLSIVYDLTKADLVEKIEQRC